MIKIVCSHYLPNLVNRLIQIHTPTINYPRSVIEESVIEEFQDYYKLEDSGILNKVQKQDMLYMHDLLKKL
ncbi:MAG: hypothetical protein Ctma_0323 [Catillopecten margaritatus gill symbiont]|uniref:Uncharacterized protein n=1 Tax=Catillopecten margaritatus gill symbiont TaxID=3083288 RepID=A0AAU6PF50_9GAMM